MLTSVVDAYENRDVMTSDIPNAFIQAEMPDISKKNEKVIMKIQGILVDMLMEMNPTLYGSKIVLENGRKVVYVWVLRDARGGITLVQEVQNQVGRERICVQSV